MCMNVLSAHIYAYHVCTWYPCTQEEAIGSPVAGVIAGYEAALWVPALNQGHLQEQSVFLIAEPFSSLRKLALNIGLATWQQTVK